MTLYEPPRPPDDLRTTAQVAAERALRVEPIHILGPQIVPPVQRHVQRVFRWSRQVATHDELPQRRHADVQGEHHERGQQLLPAGRALVRPRQPHVLEEISESFATVVCSLRESSELFQFSTLESG
ncbi:hypothetical protein MRX96_034714 [Rhipicephalus microplus]